MRLPIRKSQSLRINDEATVVYLSRAGIEKLKRELEQLKAKKAHFAEEVNRTAQYGDFSENAEYQEAKFQLRRNLSRIDTLEDRLKRVVIIEDETTDSRLRGNDKRIRIGSVVSVHTGEKYREYTIVGPHETNPLKGRISYLSPLGSALIQKTVGDVVDVTTPDGGTISYTIITVS